tara:strand:+ start:927 stop:4796 length:3870 start_codon:yes stop_codon:yes gene_type:complete
MVFRSLLAAITLLYLAAGALAVDPFNFNSSVSLNQGSPLVSSNWDPEVPTASTFAFTDSPDFREGTIGLQIKFNCLTEYITDGCLQVDSHGSFYRPFYTVTPVVRKQVPEGDPSSFEARPTHLYGSNFWFVDETGQQAVDTPRLDRTYNEYRLVAPIHAGTLHQPASYSRAPADGSLIGGPQADTTNAYIGPTSQGATLQSELWYQKLRAPITQVQAVFGDAIQSTNAHLDGVDKVDCSTDASCTYLNVGDEDQYGGALLFRRSKDSCVRDGSNAATCMNVTAPTVSGDDDTDSTVQFQEWSANFDWLGDLNAIFSTREEILSVPARADDAAGLGYESHYIYDPDSGSLTDTNAAYDSLLTNNPATNERCIHLNVQRGWYRFEGDRKESYASDDGLSRIANVRDRVFQFCIQRSSNQTTPEGWIHDSNSLTTVMDSATISLVQFRAEDQAIDQGGALPILGRVTPVTPANPYVVSAFFDIRTSMESFQLLKVEYARMQLGACTYEARDLTPRYQSSGDPLNSFEATPSQMSLNGSNYQQVVAPAHVFGANVTGDDSTRFFIQHTQLDFVATECGAGRRLDTVSDTDGVIDRMLFTAFTPVDMSKMNRQVTAVGAIYEPDSAGGTPIHQLQLQHDADYAAHEDSVDWTRSNFYFQGFVLEAPVYTDNLDEVKASVSIANGFTFRRSTHTRTYGLRYYGDPTNSIDTGTPVIDANAVTLADCKLENAADVYGADTTGDCRLVQVAADQNVKVTAGAGGVIYAQQALSFESESLFYNVFQSDLIAIFICKQEGTTTGVRQTTFGASYGQVVYGSDCYKLYFDGDASKAAAFRNESTVTASGFDIVHTNSVDWSADTRGTVDGDRGDGSPNSQPRTTVSHKFHRESAGDAPFLGFTRADGHYELRPNSTSPLLDPTRNGLRPFQTNYFNGQTRVCHVDIDQYSNQDTPQDSRDQALKVQARYGITCLPNFFAWTSQDQNAETTWSVDFISFLTIDSPIPIASDTVPVTLAVAAKSVDHEFYNQGSANAYTYDADETVVVTYGKTYRFAGDVTGHPIMIVHEDFKEGGPTAQAWTYMATTWIASETPDYTVTIDDDFCTAFLQTSGIYFACTDHEYMGAEIAVVGCPLSRRVLTTRVQLDVPDVPDERRLQDDGGDADTSEVAMGAILIDCENDPEAVGDGNGAGCGRDCKDGLSGFEVLDDGSVRLICQDSFGDLIDVITKKRFRSPWILILLIVFVVFLSGYICLFHAWHVIVKCWRRVRYSSTAVSREVREVREAPRAVKYGMSVESGRVP